jgi:hypothetical protein
LNTPHPELNSRTPVEVAVTEDGARQVEEASAAGTVFLSDRRCRFRAATRALPYA